MIASGLVDVGAVTTRRERAEAAAVLRRLLDAVESGELDVGSAHGRRLLRQLEGAVAALEAADEPRGTTTRGDDAVT
jgi:hypothetical protein